MSSELKSPTKRGPIAWMAGHSIAANLIMLVCLIGGFLSLRNIKQEVFPDIDLDAVTVSVAYPGASPDEVESGIVLAIEEAVRGLDGVDEVTSVASEGYGSVTVELLLEADVQKLSQDIKSEVDRITTFPIDAEEPQVRVASHKREVLKVILYGDTQKTLLHDLGEQVRDQLLQDPEITQVELSGVPPLEIGIEISEDNLRRYGLTLDEVASRIGSASVDVPGGGLKTPSGEILVRMKERRDYGREFAQLPIIMTSDGSQVLLGDIATIDDSFEDTDRYTEYNEQPAIILEVYRVGTQTPLTVSDAAHRQIEGIERDLPPGIGIAIENDWSEIYRQRVGLLLKNGAIGLVLVLCLLGLFLEARLAFWIMMGIPISFLGSFLFLPASDVSINMVSLFAYIIALGIVVDDAIVVGENVYRYHQEGLPFHRAAVKGAREVAVPVTFSILTNIATFAPLYFIPGVMGKFFKMIPVVVCTVFLVSLGESLFVLPAHLSHQRDRKHRGLFGWLHAKQQAFSHAFKRSVQNIYGPFLDFTLRHRYLTISIAVTILMVSLSFALSGRMGMGLFPTVESDFSQASVVLPYGSPVERTQAVVEHLTEAAQQVLDESGHEELVESLIVNVGINGSHTAQLTFVLADPEIRENIMSTEEFTNRWRKASGEIAGIETLNFSSDAGGPGGRGRPISVDLSHRDIDVLERVSSELANTISTYPRVKDVDDGFQPGKEQLDFAVKPEGKSLGLSATTVARQVRSAFYGSEVLRQQRGRNEIKIIARLPETDRATEQTLHDLLIRTPGGAYTPLREIATTERGRAYTTIDRRNGRRVVQVTADITPRSKAGEVLGDLKANVMPSLIEKYPGLSYTFEGHQADMRDSIDSLRVTFVLALMAIYAMLAIPFRSYVQPLIVMISIPFGVVGAVFGHVLMGYDLSLLSMFGIVALAGVVVNDSLVMIDFANRQRKRGLSYHDAVHSAGIQRFRPIMLTTLTTFGGLAPMIFETSTQARFLIPMAISLGFGILFATGITLVIVPSLYIATEDVRRIASGTWNFLFVTEPMTKRDQETL